MIMTKKVRRKTKAKETIDTENTKSKKAILWNLFLVTIAIIVMVFIVATTIGTVATTAEHKTQNETTGLWPSLLFYNTISIISIL